MPRFVLEIGTEELPPRYFATALPYLAEEGRALLDRARLWLPESEVKVYGTPRRLALIGERIAASQAPRTSRKRGPAVKVAFDAEGRPTKAAEGFARRWGLTPDQLERGEAEGGEYVFAVIEEPALPAAEALAPMLADLITGTPFPKTMRWGDGSLRFGRPIRWLLALVDEAVVEFSLGPLKSGRLTRGHPVLADGMHEVKSAEEYEEALKRHYVLIDPDERVERIWSQLNNLAQSHQAHVVSAKGPERLSVSTLIDWPEEFAEEIQRDLLLETAFLAEWATTACGSFDERYLRLPREVLIEEMRHVQCYFPLKDNDGKLMPKFIAVRDGGEEHLDKVLAGWESVLRAKLIDASYFYEQDLKRPLADRVEDLKGVVFHEKLGTMYEKMERVRAVARDLAEQVGLGGKERELLDRAARLCKADLTTQMVTELSNLQGVMGSHYAKKSDEPLEVADAIAEHYRPRGPSDALPVAERSCVLAVADKVDTLVAYAAMGILPSGSTDPFGLRREANGIVRIAAESPGLSFSLERLVNAALQALHKQIQLERPNQEVLNDVRSIIRQRLVTYLQTVTEDRDAVRYDLVQAALAVGFDDILDAATRARVLESNARPIGSPQSMGIRVPMTIRDGVARLGSPQHLPSSPDFVKTVTATTRVINIIKGFEGGEVDEKLLAERGEPAERALWKAYRAALEKAQGKQPEELFDLIAGLRQPIDRFFDEVLVMHEDEEIRRNRLALCWQINENLFRRLADFSLIVQG